MDQTRSPLAVDLEFKEELARTAEALRAARQECALIEAQIAASNAAIEQTIEAALTAHDWDAISPLRLAFAGIVFGFTLGTLGRMLS